MTTYSDTTGNHYNGKDAELATNPSAHRAIQRLNRSFSEVEKTNPPVRTITDPTSIIDSGCIFHQ